jgi:hypothetical protein
MPKSPEDQRLYNREYYLRNRSKPLAKQREKNRRFAEGRRKWLAEFKKGLKCNRCGEDHPATLTFHHLNAGEKDFEIGNSVWMGVSLNRLKAEIEKCEVLCANCHAKEHYAQTFEKPE